MKRSHNVSEIVPFTIMVTSVMVVGTIPHFSIATLSPFLVEDFGLTRVQFGALTTAIFSVAAGLSPFIGSAMDGYGPRSAYSALFVVSALTVAGVSFSTTYSLLLGIVAMAGIGQALANPLSNRFIAHHVSSARQGLVTGIKQSGVQISATLAGAALPLLALLLGWRGALLVVAVLVLVGWLTTVGWIPQVPATGDEIPVTPAAREDRSLIVLTVYAFMMGTAFASAGAYLPLYAHEVVGLSSVVAGTLISAMGLVGVVTRILIGYVADRMRNLRLLLAMMAFIATLAVWIVAVAAAGGALLVWIGAFLLGVSAGWNTLAMLTVVKRAGQQAVGKASGRVMAAFFAGFILAPVAFGLAVDITDGYVTSWTTLASLLLATSFIVSISDRRSRGHR